MRIEYHRTLIADHVRNAAFHAALAAHIIPGETVVADIGTGTGLLGMMAARLGAKRVYMYETAAVGAVAERAVKANKLGRLCEVIACHSTDMIDPPKADVVVSETLGNYAFEENIISTLTDAAQRHLKPGGVMIPSGVRQFAAPVVSGRFHRELSVWADAGPKLGVAIDLGEAQHLTFNNAYVRLMDAGDLLDGLASARAWDEVDFAKRPATSRKADIAWRLDRPVTIDGFAYWWTATLAPQIVLSTAPDAPRTHWEQLYFPIAAPITAAAGDEVRLTVRTKSTEEAGTHLAWTAAHFDVKGDQISRQSHDLDKGYLP